MYDKLTIFNSLLFWITMISLANSCCSILEINGDSQNNGREMDGTIDEEQ